MGDVVSLPVETTLDIPPDRVLSGAMGELDEAIVIGTGKSGFWFASSTSDLERVLWLLEKAKRQTFRMADEC